MGAVQVVTQGFALIVYLLLTFMWLMVIASVICWVISLAVPTITGTGFYRFVQGVINPVVQPFRAVIPTVNGIDFFSFILAFAFLQIVRSFVGGLAGTNFLL
jgi:uncharacterized protein YggT (Ycf19 family)